MVVRLLDRLCFKKHSARCHLNDFHSSIRVQINVPMANKKDNGTRLQLRTQWSIVTNGLAAKCYPKVRNSLLNRAPLPTLFYIKYEHRSSNGFSRVVVSKNNGE